MDTKRIRTPLLATLPLLLAGASASAQVQAQEYRFTPVADTSIYADVAGVDLSWDDVSDGQGESLWLSTTAGGVVRRALVRFDLSALPSDVQVVSASLTLFESRSRTDHLVTLHRMLAGWGEGSSDGGSQGVGAPATAGDATWRWRDYQVAEWSTRGGDFVGTASSSLVVGAQNQTYTWTGAGLAADVQQWLAQPSQNHGWILVGDESGIQSAKRFESGESPFTDFRPTLTLQVTPIPEPATWMLWLAGAALCAARRQGRRTPATA